MNPLLFLVADKNMEHALLGFFERDCWWKAAGCGRIDIDPRRDIIVAAGQCDPGLYARARELLRPFRETHEHVVVMIDAAWDGSPGASSIRSAVSTHIETAGWSKDAGLALVLDPEVDCWLWSPTPHTATTLGWRTWEELKTALEDRSLLDPGRTKPAAPKEAAEWALRQKRRPRSSALYKRVASQVSLRRCEDPALQELVAALQSWFPPQS